jgi:glutamine---fructose-6-phosphate transaminase (isomerizing)
MCGIFGFHSNSKQIPYALYKDLLEDLLILSSSRGKEAAGMALSGNDFVSIIKDNRHPKKMLKSAEYKRMVHDAKSYLSQEKMLERFKYTAIGHSRLVTNGREENYNNNQPVAGLNSIIVHNGIIVNDEQLWESNSDLDRRAEVDTEIIIALIEKYMRLGHDLPMAVKKTYKDIFGAAAVAIIFPNEDVLSLTTNNGSLYYCKSNKYDLMVFASEAYILNQIKEKRKFKGLELDTIFPVKPNYGILIQRSDGQIQNLELNGIIGEETESQYINLDIPVKYYNHLKESQFNIADTSFIVPPDLIQNASDIASEIASIKRCTRCVLPETVPFIKFDEAGVCNYCNGHEKIIYRGESEFLKQCQAYWGNGSKDCLFPFSGGRDSSYGLHIISKELGIKPVTYTYDWGMVTPLARRNISRMTSILGVENILVSADIKKKRRNIRLNVLAWLNNPDIAIIPLFMAGDKQFLFYAKQLKNQTELNLDVWCPNPFEKTNFKEEFTGIQFWDSKSNSQQIEGRGMSYWKSLKLALYYGKTFLGNPQYINKSIADTLFSYYCYYFLGKDYLVLYDYYDWNEKKIEETLINEYSWETDPGTKSTWRIGDGTAPFYNYIYHTVAGFTENDTFRSVQIREGLMDRKAAMESINEENRPRWETIRWYCDTIGIDWVNAINIINNIPKLY